MCSDILRLAPADRVAQFRLHVHRAYTEPAARVGPGHDSTPRIARWIYPPAPYYAPIYAERGEVRFIISPFIGPVSFLRSVIIGLRDLCGARRISGRISNGSVDLHGFLWWFRVYPCNHSQPMAYKCWPLSRCIHSFAILLCAGDSDSSVGRRASFVAFVVIEIEE